MQNKSTPRLKFRLILLGVICAILLLPASNSQSVPFISKEAELAMGRGADRDVIAQYGIYNNKPLQLYVNQIGQALVANLSDREFDRYFFKIVDSSEINAFALPGGYIYVTRGILGLLNSEAELAGVLGHEIGHVIQHHGAKQVLRAIGAQILSIGAALAAPEHAGELLLVTSQMFNLINLGYGKDAEMESDAHGILSVHQAGYDPESVVDFLNTLRRKEIWSGQSYHSFLATHPETKDRMIKAKMFSESLLRRNDQNLVANREIYLSHLRGMIYGGKRHRHDRKNYPKEYMDVYQVKKGDTFKSIAIAQTGDVKNDMDIAVINGMKLEDSLTEGEMLKIVKKGVYKREKVLKLKPENL